MPKKVGKVNNTNTIATGNHLNKTTNTKNKSNQTKPLTEVTTQTPKPITNYTTIPNKQTTSNQNTQPRNHNALKQLAIIKSKFKLNTNCRYTTKQTQQPKINSSNTKITSPNQQPHKQPANWVINTIQTTKQ